MMLISKEITNCIRSISKMGTKRIKIMKIIMTRKLIRKNNY